MRDVVASPPSIHPEKFSVDRVDCQNTYRRGQMQLEGAEEAITEARQLLLMARDFNLGYVPTVVARATATRALPPPMAVWSLHLRYM